MNSKENSKGLVSSSFGIPRNGLGIGSIAKALDGIGNDLAIKTSSCLGVGMSFSSGDHNGHQCRESF